MSAHDPRLGIPHRHADGRLRSADGTGLFWRAWLPADEASTSPAVLVFVHGLAEHSGRYRNPARFFVPRGHPCYAVDLRGHGRSDGAGVDVTTFDRYLDDVDALVAETRGRHPGTATVLVGHSMGGLVVLRRVLRRGDGPDAAVVSSPALAPHPSTAPPLVKRLAARVLVRLAPGLRLPTGLDPTAVSRDPEVVRAYVEDPLRSTRASSRWYDGLLRAQRDAFHDAPDLALPLLLMQSGDDRLVDPAATERWAAKAPAEHLSFRVWPGLYHEMFNEPENGEVFAHVASWLRGLASAPSRP